ncbi:MAG TPA: YdeI/OmpD-associated family protein [Candidatus Limnocylindrales bacterium]
MEPQRFAARLQPLSRGRGFVAVPFDPDAVWGTKPRHPVGGTINGRTFRGVIETHDGTPGFILGPAWLRDCGGVSVGDSVQVLAVPEGPQRGDLDADLAAALQASPRAGAFFDGLAQFYRKAYLRWIDGTKRRPQERARRIAEMITLLEAGQKQRPQ